MANGVDFRFQSQFPIAQIVQALTQKPLIEEQIKASEDERRREKFSQFLNALTTGSQLGRDITAAKAQGLANQQAQLGVEGTKELSSILAEPNMGARVSTQVPATFGQTIQGATQPGRFQAALAKTSPNVFTQAVAQNLYANKKGRDGGYTSLEQLTSIGVPQDEAQQMITAFQGNVPEQAVSSYSKAAKEETAAMERKEKSDAIQKSIKARAELITSKIDQALGKISPMTTGGMAGIADVPFLGQATGAKDLQSDLDTVKAILGFEQLEQMKNQSRAGASGLGQLSDREMKLLTAARSNLDQAQTPQQLKERLEEVKVHFNNWLMMEDGINPYAEKQNTPGNAPAINQIPQVGGTFQGSRVKNVRRIK